MGKLLLFGLVLSLARSSPSIRPSNVPVVQKQMSKLSPYFQRVLAQRLRELLANPDSRKIEWQLVQNNQNDFLIVRMFSKSFHKFETLRIQLDGLGEFAKIERNYKVMPEERELDQAVPACPDPSVEFIAFAPNDEATEQSVTIDVAQAAAAHGLKTVVLLKAEATRMNYLNYMMCPNLKGNFYDGDANTSEIVTVDGTISSDDLTNFLPSAFRYKVTNIWLACQAYNEPMLSAVTTKVLAQKYAAGINDLAVGPSDLAGACAMKAALDGSPMQEAFQKCYEQLDITSDHWGFGGLGDNLFSH